MYDPYNYDRSVGGEPEIIEERTSEVPMYQPIGPKTAASVLIRKRFRICVGRFWLAFGWDQNESVRSIKKKTVHFYRSKKFKNLEK